MRLWRDGYEVDSPSRSVPISLPLHSLILSQPFTALSSRPSPFIHSGRRPGRGSVTYVPFRPSPVTHAATWRDRADTTHIIRPVRSLLSLSDRSLRDEMGKEMMWTGDVVSWEVKEHYHKDNLRHLPRFPGFFVTFRILVTSLYILLSCRVPRGGWVVGG